MAVQGAKNTIQEAVLSWPGVSAHPHQFGGTEYRLGKREIGHIHGDHLVDIPFPTRVRDEIVAAGRAEPHHVLPDSGWVSFIYVKRATFSEQSICCGSPMIWLLHSKRGGRKCDQPFGRALIWPASAKSLSVRPPASCVTSDNFTLR